jgi:hypothetical protein
MKNVTKILTAVVLCAAIFASDQRINALGGNAALWPGDEANISAFPGSINDHALVQFSGIGWDRGEDDQGETVYTNDHAETATVLFDNDGTTWGFNYNNGGNDWFNIMWGNGDMGLSIGMLSNEDGTSGCTTCREDSGFKLGWGQTMGFGDLGVTYSSTSHTEDGSTTSDDMTDLGLNWRGDVGFWVFDGLTASYASHDTDKAGTSDDMSHTTLSATAFTHMDAGGADVLFAMGVENMSGEEGTGAGSDRGHMQMHSTVAVEANMTDWATFRLGATFNYQLSGENDWTGAGNGTITVDDNDTAWDAALSTCSDNTLLTQAACEADDVATQDNGWGLGLGLGFNWGGFSADYTITEGFFNDPVSQITGYDNGSLTSQAVTLTYSF